MEEKRVLEIYKGFRNGCVDINPSIFIHKNDDSISLNNINAGK